MKKQDVLLRYFLYAALLSIGIIIGMAIRHYTNLPIGDTINIIDLATLVTTVFLAVYIPEVLDRKLQVVRDKKELLERRILEYQALLRRVNMLVQSDAQLSVDDHLTLKNSLDVAGYKPESIGRLIQYSKLGDTFPKDMSRIKEMDREHREMLETGNENITSFPMETRQKEGELYNKLDEATTLLIFKISEIR